MVFRWCNRAGIALAAVLAAPAVAAGAGVRSAHCSVRPTALTCEFQADPIGVGDTRPALGWRLAAAREADRVLGQTACRVIAASSRERCAAGRADLWDSGTIRQAGSSGVHYGGRALRSGERIFWRVRVRDRAGKPSAWSEISTWEMGLLRPGDWKGAWIGSPGPEPASDEARFGDRPAPLLRRAFVLSEPVRSARLYVSGLGFVEVHLNGRRVGDRVLEPGWTDYRTRVPYSTYDVTNLLHAGRNAIGAMLGNGWYDPLPLRMWGWLNLREHLLTGRPCLRAQLNVVLKSGDRLSFATDGAWRTADGPIVRNSIYLGEVYDAKREMPGWDLPGFDDRRWSVAATLAGPPGRLTAQEAPPIRIHDAIRAKRISEPAPGVYLVDFGEEFAGWMEMRLRLPRSARVVVRYGELLRADGSLNPLTSVAGQIKGTSVPAGSQAPSTAWQTDTYIANGDPGACYRPRFTWHGFRYAEIRGLPSRPSLDRFVGLRLCADTPAAGEFECSNELLNRIHRMARRTFRSNLMSVQSDCPHRERFGYGGDMVATADATMVNFDMSRFYAKACRDYEDAARPDGALTETAPFVGIADAGLGGGSGPVEWGTALPWLAWRLYGAYGDSTVLSRHYRATRRWVDFLLAHAKDGILDNGIGDHETLAPKSVAVTGTAFLWANCRLLARIAGALGNSGDSRRYGSEADRIERAFRGRFLNAANGKIDTGTQADQATALFFGLVPDSCRNRAMNALLDDIAAHNHHLTTGIFGTPFMLQTLSSAGHADEALRIVTQRTFPGWGYMLAGGATTLWEHWDFSDSTFSHNHPMFGSVDAWLMAWIAGIQRDPEAVGFDRIVIRPQPVGDLTWARASLETVRGPIAVSWRRSGGRFRLEVRIPPNATARVVLPASDPGAATESGEPLRRARGVRAAAARGSETVVEIGSGCYRFVCPVR